MKRSAPLVRKTALRRTSALTTARRRELTARTPQQERRARFERELAAAKVTVRQRSQGRCEYDGTDCENRAVHVHHKLQGRTHPRCNEPDFLLDLCAQHHAQIHAEPAVSYSQGWLLRDSEVPR